MEEQKRLRLSRWGYRSHLATLTTSLTELTQRCKEQSPGEEDIIILTSLLEQFTRKKEILHALDEKLAQLTDEKDLEAEILESEELQNSISRQITTVKHLLNTPRTSRPSHETQLRPTRNPSPENEEENPGGNQEERQSRGPTA